ncbi:hypothetical protein HUJ05_005106 [Dendroctonus ponderosae]|nr:hypothetical protein HUJ05_005106 [Dendroctonus ponderosae]
MKTLTTKKSTCPSSRCLSCVFDLVPHSSLLFSAESSSEEDSLANDEGPTVESTPEREKASSGIMRGGSGGDRGHHGFPPPPPSDTSSAGSPPPLQRRPRAPPPLWNDQRGRNQQEITDISDVLQNFRPYSQPPDVTNNTAQGGRRTGADRVNRYTSSASEDGTMGTGTGRWKVSAKIQQLLNTLKRPKRRPLPEFYEDDDIELELAANPKDPNAPKPEGSFMSPAVGEQLTIPSGLPRSIGAAILRYGNASYKAPVATVLDPNGKLSTTLTYGKLLSRSYKIAYALLTKSFSKNGDTSLKSGDRVALVYPNNDPINFLCAYYGCIQAGIVPVPIEVPITRRDAGSLQIGFLLGSCAVQVALTSEACLKGLPKTTSGEIIQFKGWPKLTWFVTEHLAKTPKDWTPQPRLNDVTAAYIEYSTDRDGSVMGVTITREAMDQHCRMLTMACNYTEGENMVCVLDFKREVGLWHSVLTSVLNGMHVIYIPYALMKANPASWMQMITKYRASVAIVKSRDLHWGLLATKDHKDINLGSLRMLLVADGANPWSLSSCDQFLSVFQPKGLRPDAICPCASSSECVTVSVRRPGRGGVNATGRGVLSMQGLSFGVVRVDQENSLTSLTLQDCGQVMPGCVIVVVKMEGPSYLCKTDEVGEICVHSGATGTQYWGLPGLSNTTFKVQPLGSDGTPISASAEYTRSGLLGFLGPGGLFIYRGRIAVFSIRVLRDERICVIAEQRPDCSEEESFQWMSRVLQAVDSIHQVGIYCLALVPPNYLPKTPLGGIHLSETKRRFLEGALHPANVLMCPHTCVTNLPKPREVHSASDCVSDVGPASVIVGNLVQGNRLASAQGREVGGLVEEDGDSSKKQQMIAEILRWRAQSTSDHVLFTLLNSKGAVAKVLSCSELHKKAERIGNLLVEKGRVNTGDPVALIFPPGRNGKRYLKCNATPTAEVIYRSPRAVSTSFGCRVNVAICLQGASSPEPSTVYVDLRALRNDRVSLVERGSPHSLCLMESGKLLPGVKVIIANPETKGGESRVPTIQLMDEWTNGTLNVSGQCGDSHLGEIWVQSGHNASGYYTILAEESEYRDHFNARLVTGNTGEIYARTGYLGFLRRTEGVESCAEEAVLNQSDNESVGSSHHLVPTDSPELHDAVFVVGSLDETIMLRGMRYHPIDIENSVLRCHKKIGECAVFTWTNLLVVVVELDGNESEALDLVPLVTNTVLEDHHLIVGVVVVVDPGVIPINSRGEKQRMHLRDGFLADQLDPIYVAYNM